MNINHPGLDPIEVIVTGSVRVLRPDVEIAAGGEMVPGGRRETLLQFYSDRGRRTVALKFITVR